jgi:hypothetical protein
MMKFIFSLILMCIAMMLPSAAYAHGQPLNIIYTGSINGELEPCGCSPKTDFGGLTRLSGYLAEHDRELSPFILIDAGNFTDSDTPQGKLKAEAFLKSYNIMKYDAVAFMSNEKTFSQEFLLPVLKDNAIPAVSDAPGLNQTLTVRREGLNVNISVNPESCRKDSLNVLLTDRPLSEARLIKGWDVIISSSGEILDEPLKVNGTVILAGYPRGKKTGILALTDGSEGGVLNYSHTWLSLGSDVKEDPRVRAVLNAYDSRVAGLLKESAKPPAGDTYLGVVRCAECHQPFQESWQKTRHAGAFDSLIKAGKSNDPECIVCHSVGYGEKGGFFTIETTPELANVQCEECHGLDREHIEDYSRPMKRVTEKVCLKCHTKENSPDFDYPVYLKKIIH